MALNLDLYKHFLDEKEAEKYFNVFRNLDWKPIKRRQNKTYGNKGLSYDIKFRNGTVNRKAIEWTPELLTLKKLIEEQVKETFTICVVQYYPCGKVGINPHKDKEMKKGTIICGLSLGQERKLKMEKSSEKYEFDLPSGSLYVMKPPTNDNWTHSIEKDDSVNSRVSLTFRNY